MREVRISDVTMKQAANVRDMTLSFKEKLEMAKLLDRLGASSIEVEGVEHVKADCLRIKSLASIVKNSVLAVPVSLDPESVEITWDALKGAAKPRLQVQAAVSPAQIEYIFRKKADSMKAAIAEMVAACVKVCPDVEFVADDATRADFDYLCDVINAAIDAGATTVTVCDAAGAMLPEEFGAFVRQLREAVPTLANVTLGVSCSDDLHMANACAVGAIVAGADEVKATSYFLNVALTEKVARVLNAKADVIQVSCGVRTTEIGRIKTQISRMCESATSNAVVKGEAISADDEDIVLTEHDDIEAVMECVNRLGYELSVEDAASVYEAVQRIAKKKESVGSKELNSIVASEALQVPPTYTVDNYVINSGNIMTATARVCLLKNGEKIEAVGMGDGPIDAAFRAIESIVGSSYELDDFQIRAVTEGQEAMGEAVIKIVANGKVYSGLGISTDIVGSSIRAYVNAANKVVYEEQN